MKVKNTNFLKSRRDNFMFFFVIVLNMYNVEQFCLQVIQHLQLLTKEITLT